MSEPGPNLEGSCSSVGLFLTPTEVLDLTGCRQKAAQRRWLNRNGIPYFVRADGSPAVHRDAVAPSARRGRPERASGQNLDLSWTRR